ncbi:MULTISPECIES: MDR family MFS transporter [unclassified Frondihabitans]|uniref:MDR family MFS transporter n=1 Tax=unclassified Frondihabitans TaxID=2626248 RepID=UPI000FAC4BFA|nr:MULTISPECIES: MDR family MFS transporter [unclassified Frondihabitans]RPE78305.1 EmrB/QacA subfamily drug resistance transporter [Frondihabitans sp. PhB153]RPF08586.1 EmrB/QacA subfamily drug resistance transporter [Frondihabitans sp. PhB161]
MSRADTAAPETAPVEKQGLMNHRQILFVIFGLMAGMFLSSLDQTIVGTAIRTIGDDLHGLDHQAWVTTAYLICSTISTPIYGKLSDLFGRRPLFIIAIAIFILGSAAASFSDSMYMLAAFRGLQGLGAGGLMALPLAIMGDILAPRQRAKYQGYFLAVFGISSVIGPLIGGLFAGADQILFITGWRWVFLLNVPIGVVALFIVGRFLHIPGQSRKDNIRIDWWGAAMVIVSAAPLLLVAEQGRIWGWGSLNAWVCYVIGGLGIIAFIVAERMMGDAALIPLKLFKSRTFSMATILGVLVGFGMFGALLTVPLYLQLVNGSTPTESGFQMLPMILGLMISSIVSGQIISRTGQYKMFPPIGTAFMILGFAWFSQVSYDKPWYYLSIGMVLVGLGLGQLMQTLTLASQNSVGPRDIGVATSSSTFFRQIGGTLGTAVLFSVLFSRLSTTIPESFQDKTLAAAQQKALADPSVLADPNNSSLIALLKKAASGDTSALGNALNGDTSFLNKAALALKAPFLDGFANATVTVFTISLVVVAVAFVLSFFLRPAPLRTRSALDEAAHQDATDAAASDARDAEETDRAALAAQSAANTMGSPVSPDTGSIRLPGSGSSTSHH